MNLECENARLKRELIEMREENVRLIYERTIYEREAERLRAQLKQYEAMIDNLDKRRLKMVKP